MGTETVAGAVQVRGTGATKPNYLIVNSDGSVNVSNPASGTPIIVIPQRVSGTNIENVTTVGDTVVNLLAANATRSGGTIQNHDSTVLGLAFTPATVFADCCVLLQQYASMNLSQAGMIQTGAIYGIRDSGNSGPVGVCEE